MPLAPTRIIPITRKALHCDGIDDYIQTGQGIFSSQPTEITILVYYKPIADADYGPIMIHDASRDKVGIHHYPGQFWQAKIFVNGTMYFTGGHGHFNYGEWYLVGLRWRSGDYLQLIANGSYYQRDLPPAGYPLDIDPATSYVKIQWDPNASGVNEYAYAFVYLRYLSDDEIQQIYNDLDHPPKSGLVLWLHDTSIDIENNVWRDLSGNGNNATIYGATAVDVVRPATRVLDATRVIEPTR